MRCCKQRKATQGAPCQCTLMHCCRSRRILPEQPELYSHTWCLLDLLPPLGSTTQLAVQEMHEYVASFLAYFAPLEKLAWLWFPRYDHCSINVLKAWWQRNLSHTTTWDAKRNSEVQQVQALCHGWHFTYLGSPLWAASQVCWR
jgi:hypothetical protein